MKRAWKTAALTMAGALTVGTAITLLHEPERRPDAK